MTPEAIVLFCAIFNFIFGIFHLFFWKLFDWKNQLSKLSIINQAVVPVLNLCLTFVFAIFSFLLFFHSQEIISTSLGHSLLVLIALFWALRAMEQVIFFGVKRSISISFFMLFLIGAALHALPLIIL